jgi:hypothetical protein
MNRATSSPRSRRTSSERAELLRALTAAVLRRRAFARTHQIHYTTFCGWRQRQEEAAGSSSSTSGRRSSFENGASAFAKFSSPRAMSQAEERAQFFEGKLQRKGRLRRAMKTSEPETEETLENAARNTHVK